MTVLRSGPSGLLWDLNVRKGPVCNKLNISNNETGSEYGIEALLRISLNYTHQSHVLDRAATSHTGKNSTKQN